VPPLDPALAGKLFEVAPDGHVGALELGGEVRHRGELPFAEQLEDAFLAVGG
jgi:hypothetical protein